MSVPTVFSQDSLGPSSPHHSPRDDERWCDTHEPFESDDHRDRIHELPNLGEGLSVASPKAPTPRKSHNLQPASSTSLPSLPATPPLVQDGQPHQETRSMQDVPVVQVTEPTSPNPSLSARSSVFASSATTLNPTNTSIASGRDRRRSTIIDSRTSHRISGFFSSLIHRRDSPTPVREPVAPPSEPNPPPRSSSRASSPLPSRPTTPPPTLPPPSLNDLGLSLANLTPHLSPSHFSSPPSSGAFLSPNYLLLCHAQGLDVLPLASPPVIQPYALIRRVPFKSVVVMEHRGVLVAIAGRRDGVRVYALDEVKRAVEWRMEVEIRRELERARREEARRVVSTSYDTNAKGSVTEENVKLFSTVHSGKEKSARRASISSIQPIPSPGIPRTPTIKRTKLPITSATPLGPPPAYSPTLRGRSSHINLDPSPGRARTTSVSDVLAGTINRRRFSDDVDHHPTYDDTKGDWASSDDEAINPVAAPGGSQALDERTSGVAALAPSSIVPSGARLEVPYTAASSQSHGRRHRPTNLDLSFTSHTSSISASTPVPPSPTPTLTTLRQALLSSPGSSSAIPAQHRLYTRQDEADLDEEEGEVTAPTPTTPTRERISLAEALLESRLPDLPPIGSRQPQDAILLSSVASGSDDAPASPRSSESHSRLSTGIPNRRRRRWSVLDGIFTPSSSHASRSSVHTVPDDPPTQAASLQGPPPIPDMRIGPIARSHSTRMPSSPIPTTTVYQPSTSRPSVVSSQEPLTSSLPPSPPAAPSLSSRLIPRIITNALNSRRSDDRSSALPKSALDPSRSVMTPTTIQAPAPKLEYVKLPGTKGAVMVKAVETGRKSFLAILCGDNGEKVELFAGTYRTALGLSRTFILPDSPRSLELQLQGDDLVEVFLVFSQNVFGLEPATVRVREVRIGRAERRAARRRAREGRAADQQAAEGDLELIAGNDDDVPMLAVSVAVTPPTDDSAIPVVSSSPHNLAAPFSETSNDVADATDELLTMAAASANSYTTFQQLSFAPQFPLAAIADDYVIPPTYPSFAEYRNQHEPEAQGQPTADPSQVQFSPPGLPIPVPVPPSKWFYRDPKGVIHGPWKATLMQAWYQDGLLPPELPIRREEDAEFTMLKDLRLQCVDPAHPFRSSPPPPVHTQAVALPLDGSKPLLKPISLLKQPRHFGPPSLFFSSRGGHSTVVVDARGRSVLKGRFMWSPDPEGGETYSRLGDVKRLEAFDIKDRAVLVAIRRGGLEAVDFGDALLRPADHSRTVCPTFNPPLSSINRRGAFVWKIGTPSSSSAPPTPGLPAKFPAHRLQPKKQNSGPTKSPARSEFHPSGWVNDMDSTPSEEILFLARRENEIFLCERRAGSFRILRLFVTSAF